MTAITTHVLDTAAGHPAAGIPVSLHERDADGGWGEIGVAVTGADGRVPVLADVGPGRYRLVLATATPFFDEVIVTFRAAAGDEHLHIPVLLSPYGYTVYRGS